jgi:P pilus assembly chaperone PapD
MTLKIIFFILIGAYTFLSNSSKADVVGSGLVVSPTRVEFKDGEKVASVHVVSKYQDSVVYRISILPPLGDEKAVVENKAMDGSAFIRSAPRQITLQEGQSQLIRLALRPGASKGDYVARLKIEALPPSAPIEETEENAQGMKTQIVMVYAVTIPILWSN